MRYVLKVLVRTIIGILVVVTLFSVVLFFYTKGSYSVPLTVEDDASLPHISIGNTVFHAETFGSDTNEVVVVLHGGPGNDYRYLLPLKAMADNYFVVFYDQRGSGLSPRVAGEEHSLENSLNDLHGIINHYAPERKVNLIGHSWGAMLAAGYVAQNPDKVKKVVLAEPGMLTTEQAQQFNKLFKISFSFSLLKEMVIAGFESLHLENSDKQARIDYLFGKITSLDVEENPMRKYFCNEDMSTGYMPFWRLSGVASAAIHSKAKDEAGNIHIDLVSGLENYSRKVLFLVGACNQVIGETFQKEHVKYFTNAQMVVIDNAGHTMLGEKTAECLNVIETYFQEE